MKLPNVDVAKISGGDKVAEIYEQFHVQDNLISICKIRHLGDHGARLLAQLAEVDATLGPGDHQFVVLVDD